MWVKCETFESLLKFWRMYMQLYLRNRRLHIISLLSKINRDTEIEISIMISSLWDVQIKKTTRKNGSVLSVRTDFSGSPLWKCIESWIKELVWTDISFAPVHHCEDFSLHIWMCVLLSSVICCLVTFHKKKKKNDQRGFLRFRNNLFVYSQFSWCCIAFWAPQHIFRIFVSNSMKDIKAF